MNDNIIEKYHYDDVADKLTIERVQDVEPTLEANKKAYNLGWNAQKGVVRLAARIPMVIIEDYLNRGIDLINDERAMKQFLNDPDNKYLRTMPGKV